MMMSATTAIMCNKSIMLNINLFHVAKINKLTKKMVLF